MENNKSDISLGIVIAEVSLLLLIVSISVNTMTGKQYDTFIGVLIWVLSFMVPIGVLIHLIYGGDEDVDKDVG